MPKSNLQENRCSTCIEQVMSRTWNGREMVLFPMKTVKLTLTCTLHKENSITSLVSYNLISLCILYHHISETKTKGVECKVRQRNRAT